LFEGFGVKEREISEERGVKRSGRKKLQNKFGGSRKCFYLCSPNKNGILQQAEGAMPEAIPDERFIPDLIRD